MIIKEIKKVAAIGVRVSKWIAYHGFSINICNNLKNIKQLFLVELKIKVY